MWNLECFEARVLCTAIFFPSWENRFGVVVCCGFSAVSSSLDDNGRDGVGWNSVCVGGRGGGKCQVVMQSQGTSIYEVYGGDDFIR